MLDLTIVYIFTVTLRVKGGEVPGGSSLAPKIGPLGMVGPVRIR